MANQSRQVNIFEAIDNENMQINHFNQPDTVFELDDATDWYEEESEEIPINEYVFEEDEPLIDEDGNIH